MNRRHTIQGVLFILGLVLIYSTAEEHFHREPLLTLGELFSSEGNQRTSSLMIGDTDTAAISQTAISKRFLDSEEGSWQNRKNDDTHRIKYKKISIKSANDPAGDLSASSKQNYDKLSATKPKSSPQSMVYKPAASKTKASASTPAIVKPSVVHIRTTAAPSVSTTTETVRILKPWTSTRSSKPKESTTEKQGETVDSMVRPTKRSRITQSGSRTSPSEDPAPRVRSSPVSQSTFAPLQVISTTTTTTTTAAPSLRSSWRPRIRKPDGSRSGLFPDKNKLSKVVEGIIPAAAKSEELEGSRESEVDEFRYPEESIETGVLEALSRFPSPEQTTRISEDLELGKLEQFQDSYAQESKKREEELLESRSLVSESSNEDSSLAAFSSSDRKNTFSSTPAQQQEAPFLPFRSITKEHEDFLRSLVADSIRRKEERQQDDERRKLELEEKIQLDEEEKLKRQQEDKIRLERDRLLREAAEQARIQFEERMRKEAEKRQHQEEQLKKLRQETEERERKEQEERMRKEEERRNLEELFRRQHLEKLRKEAEEHERREKEERERKEIEERERQEEERERVEEIIRRQHLEKLRKEAEEQDRLDKEERERKEEEDIIRIEQERRLHEELIRRQHLEKLRKEVEERERKEQEEKEIKQEERKRIEEIIRRQQLERLRQEAEEHARKEQAKAEEQTRYQEFIKQQEAILRQQEAIRREQEAAKQGQEHQRVIISLTKDENDHRIELLAKLAQQHHHQQGSSLATGRRVPQFPESKPQVNGHAAPDDEDFSVTLPPSNYGKRIPGAKKAGQSLTQHEHHPEAVIPAPKRHYTPPEYEYYPPAPQGRNQHRNEDHSAGRKAPAETTKFTAKYPEVPLYDPDYPVKKPERIYTPPDKEYEPPSSYFEHESLLARAVPKPAQDNYPRYPVPTPPSSHLEERPCDKVAPQAKDPYTRVVGVGQIIPHPEAAPPARPVVRIPDHYSPQKLIETERPSHTERFEINPVGSSGSRAEKPLVIELKSYFNTGNHEPQRALQREPEERQRQVKSFPIHKDPAPSLRDHEIIQLILNSAKQEKKYSDVHTQGSQREEVRSPHPSRIHHPPSTKETKVIHPLPNQESVNKNRSLEIPPPPFEFVPNIPGFRIKDLTIQASKEEPKTYVKDLSVFSQPKAPIAVNKDYIQHHTVVPGKAGVDYPNYETLPETGFNCDTAPYPGYYADRQTRCQVFHVCQTNHVRDSFLCPNGTIFNQKVRVCDWWYNVKCDSSPDFYYMNEFLYADKPGRI